MDAARELLNKIKDEGLENALGIYPGWYDAIVADTDDPEKRFRIKVRQDDILGKGNVSSWALPSQVISDGAGNGIFAFPKNGQLIRVSFDLGMVNHPRWSFGALGKEGFPTDLNNQKLILVQEGNLFSISAEDNTIKLIQKDGFEITLGPEGIEIKSKDVSLHGLIKELFDWLKESQIINGAGQGKFTPDSLAKLEQITTKLPKLFKS